MCRDLDFFPTISLHSDAVAAIGIARRRGIGRIRHLDTEDLWIQEKVRTNEINLMKIDGKKNPADLFTKYLDHNEMLKHLHFLGVDHASGRSDAAPKLVDADANTDEENGKNK